MSELNESCKSCIHRDASKTGGTWYCKLNSLSELHSLGHKVDSSTLPEEFVCDDYEPP